MDATKEVIADAVRQFRVTDSDDWAQRFAGCEFASIEAGPLNFQTHDVLFDGTAKVLLRRGSETEDVLAHVYGRSDGRRAVIDRFVMAS